MRTIFLLVQKEFIQVFRDKTLLTLIFLGPIVQLFVLPLIANYGVRNISIAIVDYDHSPYSQQLIRKILSSRYFELGGYASSYKDGRSLVKRDEADLILEIPNGFERDLVRQGQQKVFIAINAINGIKGSLGGAYLSEVLSDFNSEIRLQWMRPERFDNEPRIEIRTSDWYNPYLSFLVLMVPGFLVTLLTNIGSFLTALNIVKEKESGTIEQLNVSPIRKSHIIIGKLLPFWILGVVDFSIGLLIARFVYDIVPVGSVLLIYLFLAIYLTALLGLGLLISTYSETQQQAISISYFVVMLFTFLSGLYTPLDAIPIWAKVLSQINPLTHFITVIRMVMLKGSTFSDVLYPFAAIVVLSLIFNLWAISNYKKTV